MDTREFAPEDEDLRGVGRRASEFSPLLPLAKRFSRPCACGCGVIVRTPNPWKAYASKKCQVRAAQRRRTGRRISAAVKAANVEITCEICESNHGSSIRFDGMDFIICRKCHPESVIACKAHSRAQSQPSTTIHNPTRVPAL